MNAPHAVATPLVWASRVLNEAVMGFLALIALATAIGPLVFDASPATDRLLGVVDWVVLGLFVVEFIVQFAVGTGRTTCDQRQIELVGTRTRCSAVWFSCALGGGRPPGMG